MRNKAVTIDEACNMLNFNKSDEVNALISMRFGLIRHVMYRRKEILKLLLKYESTLCLGGNITAFIDYEIRIEQPQITLFETLPDEVRHFKQKYNL